MIQIVLLYIPNSFCCLSNWRQSLSALFHFIYWCHKCIYFKLIAFKVLVLACSCFFSLFKLWQTSFSKYNCTTIFQSFHCALLRAGSVLHPWSVCWSRWLFPLNKMWWKARPSKRSRLLFESLVSDYPYVVTKLQQHGESACFPQTPSQVHDQCLLMRVS